MAGATQSRVRQTMLDAGGYWRPLAAVARLLEELGELAELLAEPSPATDALGGELADLWIITAALADQYLVEVPEPGTGVGGAVTERGSSARAGVDHALAALIAAAGAIARIVNYYDGPKTPRRLAELPALATAVPDFHDQLARLAGALGIDLAKAVDAKLEVIHATDMQRFSHETRDPRTAPILARLRAAEPATEQLRLWGAPSTDPAHSLRSFLRACGPERLDAYVIEEPLLAALGPERLGLAVERRGGFLLLRGRGRGHGRMLAGPGDDLP